MQVKFKDEKSAKEAMDQLDGMEIGGSKLQVTQIFLLRSFNPKPKNLMRCSTLSKIQESKDSDDSDLNISNENDSFPPTIEEDDHRDKIEKNITDLIDTNDDTENKDTDSKDYNISHPSGYYEMGIGDHYNPHYDQWNNIDNMGYSVPQNSENYSENLMYDQNDYQRHHDRVYQISSGVAGGQGHLPYNPSANYQMNSSLFHNNSASSIVHLDNFSHSEESDFPDGFNRTQSVRLCQNNMNTGALTSRLNSSYESGLFDDEEAKQSSRSYFSSRSRESNANVTSTCARTFTSSGGMVERNNSQMQLTYDMHQMHSSFDVGNDSNYNSYKLTPRHMSDFSYDSGQFYNKVDHFNSFQGFQGTRSDQYATISAGGLNRMRNCLSVASLDGGRVYSNPSENFNNLSFNSVHRQNKKRLKNKIQKGFIKRSPVKDEDSGQYSINIDNIVQRKDERTTLMIKNIPNKYTIK
jgi:hypothetical protein